jgi:hypothetical protein
LELQALLSLYDSLESDSKHSLEASIAAQLMVFARSDQVGFHELDHLGAAFASRDFRWYYMTVWSEDGRNGD